VVEYDGASRDSKTRESVLLQAAGVSKTFGGAKALSGVNLEVYSGEVHALLGANGAGKSTLIKILSGIHQPDAGTIFWAGRPVTIRTLSDVRNHAIATMFQHLNVPGELTVAEYLTLGREGSGLLSVTHTRAQAKTALEQLGVEIDLAKLCNQLSVAELELLEIARAISQDAQLVIMDEPTASLGSVEVEQLFRVIQRLRERNVSVIYVSHKLEEVLAICDRATVIKDGKNVGTVEIAQTDQHALLTMMVGSFARAETHRRSSAVTGSTVLKVTDLATEKGLSRINFTLRRGEILGVYGLMGAGRTELLQSIYGCDRITAGSVAVDEELVTIRSPYVARSLGIGLVPEDRIREALIPDSSVAGNLSLASGHRVSSYGIFRPKREKLIASEMINRMGIKTSGSDAPISTLSGGNQQKVVFGRWLVAGVRILLLDDPTVGVDVPAKQEIYRTIRELAKQGVAILLCSSELSEILSLADRVLVMHRKSVVADLLRDQTNAEQLERLSILGTRER